MGKISKWRVYCVTEGDWRYVWQEDEPTACPVDAGHTVRPDSTSAVTTVSHAKRLKSDNSPYVVRKYNFFRCDTEHGDIELYLPAASGENQDRVIVVLKEHQSNNVTVRAYGSELIDGSSTAQLSALQERIKLVSDGDNWTSVPMETLVDDAKIDRLTRTSDDLWVFRETQPNAIHNGANVRNSWTPRTLNQTLVDSGSEVTRNGSELTLQQGVYDFQARSVFYRTNFTRMRLRNLTDSNTVAVSLNAYAQSLQSCEAFLRATVTVATTSAETFRIEYYCSNRQRHVGLGRANGNGEEEVYSIVEIARK